MYYHNVTEDEAKKLIKKDAVRNGIVFIVIGIMFAVVCIGTLSKTTDITDYFIGGFFFLAFTAAGIYLFCQPSIAIKKDQALDDPDSKVYRKNQAVLESRRKFIVKNSRRRKKLKHLSGRDYKKVLEEYSRLGMNTEEAESDFSESKYYAANYGVFSVSRKVFLSAQDRFVLPVSSAVWVFTGYKKHYTARAVTRQYHLLIFFENGYAAKVICPEELCSQITEDIAENGNCVTTGYSAELMQLYLDAPDKFRYAVKPASEIQYRPVNLSLRPLPQTIYYVRE